MSFNRRKSPRVGLLTTLRTNIGDDFIREGLMHVIERLLPANRVEFVPVNKHEPGSIYGWWHPLRWLYSPALRRRRNTGLLRVWAGALLPPFGFSQFDSCDMILQCGTPIIWAGCRNSQWAELIWRDVLRRLGRAGVPVLNLGGGSCYPLEKCPASLCDDPDEPFIRLMLDAAHLTTVRDRLAAELFSTLGYASERVCCPALLAGQLYVEPAKPTRKVVINFMRVGGHSDWGQNVDPQAWENSMREVIAHLRGDDWQPLLLAHNQKEFQLAKQLWPELPRTCPEGPAEYFAVTRDAAFGLVNRMHASVALAGLGIPSVAVGTDSRLLMVENLGLPTLFVKEASSSRMLLAISEILRRRETESQRLLSLREATLKRYENYLRPFVASLQVDGAQNR